MTRPYVGIDVAKATLDVAIGSDGEMVQVENSEAGIAQLVKRLGEAAPALVVLEATGGYESLVAAAVAGREIAVAIVNPRQVRDFAKATGVLAKDGQDRCPGACAIRRGCSAGASTAADG